MPVLRDRAGSSRPGNPRRAHAALVLSSLLLATSAFQAATPALAGEPTVGPLVTCSTDASVFNTGHATTTVGEDSNVDASWDVSDEQPVTEGTPGYPTTLAYHPAYVMSYTPGGWQSPVGGGSWITRENGEASGTGDWYYRYRFTLDGSVDPSALSLKLDFMADNSVQQIWVNQVAQSGKAGVANLPQASDDPYNYTGFYRENATSTTLAHDWKAGANEMVVLVKSGENLEGFVAGVSTPKLCKDPDVAASTATPQVEVAQGQPVTVQLQAGTTVGGGPMPAGSTIIARVTSVEDTLLGVTAPEGWTWSGSQYGYTYTSATQLAPNTSLGTFEVKTQRPGGRPSGSQKVTLTLTLLGSLTDPNPDNNAATVTEIWRPTTTQSATGSAVSGRSSITTLPTFDGTGPFTYELVTAVAGASVSGNSVTWTPPTSVSGTVVQSYRAIDADGAASVSMPLTWTVRPDASADHMVATSGTSTTHTLPTPAGVGPFTWTVTTPPGTGQGTLSIDNEGKATYTGPSDFSDTVMTKYTVSGQGGTSDAADLSITVRPAALVSQLTTTVNTPVTADLPVGNGTQPLTYRAVTQPAHGEVDVMEGRTITYRPATNYSGPDSFTYTVANGELTSQAATVTILVSPTVAPVTSAVTDPGTAVAGPAPTPAGTGPFTYSLVGHPEGATIDTATGVITFTPAPDSSTDAVIGFTAVDAAGTSTSTTATFPVRPVSAAPTTPKVAAGDAVTLATATPVGTGPFTYQVLNETAPGTADFVDGALVYQSVKGTSGDMAFVYVVIDADGTQSAAIPVVVTVMAPPATPPAPTVVPATSSMLVSWDPSTDPDVTGYTVTSEPDGTSCFVAAGEEPTCLLGATVGQPTQYRLVTHSVWGDSEPSVWSPEASAIAPIVTPTAPTASGSELSGDVSGELQPGQQITVRGGGFLPFSTVVIAMYPGPVTLGTAVAGADGTFEATVTVPAVAGGAYTIVAFGINPSGEDVTASMPVTVAAAPVVLPSAGGGSPWPLVGGLVLLVCGGALLLRARRTA